MKFEGIDQLQEMTQDLDKAEVRKLNQGENELKTHAAIWNTTKDYLESVVKKSNSDLINHTDAFNFVTEAVKKHGIPVEGEILNCGGTVSIEMSFKDRTVDIGGDKIRLGVRFENNYNGTAPRFKGEAFGFREKCSNGMFLGVVLTRSFTNRHLKMADIEKSVLELIEKTLDSSSLLEENIRKAMEDTLEPKEAKEIIAGELTGKKKKKEIWELAESQDTLTRYTLYNAITEYATFSAKDEKHKTRLQAKAQKILVTPLKKLKRDEWEESDE